MRRITAAVALAGTLMWSQSSGALDGTLNMEAQPVELVVVVYKDVHAMRRAVRELYGKRLHEVEELHGFAAWTISGSKCTLHLVRLPHTKRHKPTGSHGIWGHELSHCLYGTIHEEE